MKLSAEIEPLPENDLPPTCTFSVCTLEHMKVTTKVYVFLGQLFQKNKTIGNRTCYVYET